MKLKLYSNISYIIWYIIKTKDKSSNYDCEYQLISFEAGYDFNSLCFNILIHKLCCGNVWSKVEFFLRLFWATLFKLYFYKFKFQNRL